MSTPVHVLFRLKTVMKFKNDFKTDLKTKDILL